MRPFYKHLLFLTFTISLSACGGSGSGNNVAVPNPAEPGTLSYRLGTNTYVIGNQESGRHGSSSLPYEGFTDAVDVTAEYGASVIRAPADWQFWNETINDTSWAEEAATYFKYRLGATKSKGVDNVVVCTTARGTDNWPTAEDGIESYCKNVVAIVKAYKEKMGKFPDIEIGNEVTNENLWLTQSGQSSYTEIVSRTRQKLNAAGLGATRIWASSVSNNTGAKISQLAFLSYCLSSGIDSKVDGYVLNLYKGHAPGSFPEDNAPDLAAFAVATTKPVRISEFGYHTSSWTSQQQVALNLRAYLSILIGSGSRADVRACLYEIRDRGDNGLGFCNGARTAACQPLPNTSECYFGLVDQSLTPKPGSARWKQFFTELGKFKFASGGPTTPGGTDYSVTLTGPAPENKTATVTWKKTSDTNDPGYYPTWVIN